MLLRLAGLLLDAFCPTACAGCDAPGPVCADCATALDGLPGQIRTGGGPWRGLEAGGWAGDEPGLAVCLGSYAGLLRRFLVAAKRGRHPAAGPALAARLVARIGAGLPRFFAGLDGILAPPPAPDRLLSHPAPVLARALADASGLPLLQDLVLRRATPGKARWLERTARPAHVGATFLAGPGRIRHGSRILLVDDLTTTGATLAHLQRLLALRGVAVARVATLAQTPRYGRTGPAPHGKRDREVPGFPPGALQVEAHPGGDWCSPGPGVRFFDRPDRPRPGAPGSLWLDGPPSSW